MSSGHVQPLTDGWQLLATAPGAATHPVEIEKAEGEWLGALVPGTAASSLRAAGRFTLDGPGRRFDAEDWWYRGQFEATKPAPDERVVLCFDGLATLVDVWLNDTLILRADNMFVSHEVDVGHLLASRNQLHLHFKALDPLLAMRRPRPRWRAPMVQHQQLRWFRTTLLGRTPGWSPPAAAVGPWRAIRLERRRGIQVQNLRLRPRLLGTTGRLEISATLSALGTEAVSGVTAHLEGQDGPVTAALQIEKDPSGTMTLRGSVDVPDVKPWWPHTHGGQPLYALTLALQTGDETLRVAAGRLGFRTVQLETATGAKDTFGLLVNGHAVFCRGACWTPLDVVTLTAPAQAIRAALQQVVDAGMNMVRVVGPMVYEDDDFYDLCDELGLLVWQDFMFANMDYPADDPAFAASVTTEARQVLARWQRHPSLALVCGDSEGEQQAAMWGAARPLWSRPLFRETLPVLTAQICPDVPYWPSSASGGDFPHQVDAGSSSYYGVGAYLRPLDDARRSGVRFASECLGFANVPDERTLALVNSGSPVRVHQPEWKARVPRDLGAGWDFDDVRDHYLKLLFGVDAASLRYADHDRYLALSRVVTGEVMAQAFAEWRRPGSDCRGALVFFLRDLWPGAGWGVVDATGSPKAAFYYLRRALQPVTMIATDEGLNGLRLHVLNEHPDTVTGQVQVALYRRGEFLVAQGHVAVTVPARGHRSVAVAALLEGFSDVTYAYRFGPAGYDLVVGTLFVPPSLSQPARLPTAGGTIAETFAFPLGLSAVREVEVGLSALARPLPGGNYALTLHTRRFALSIAIDAHDFRPDDNHFHLAPGASRTITLRAAPGSSGPLRGHAQPLNAEIATKFLVHPA